jgi:peptidoglycan-associated lipoprotein
VYGEKKMKNLIKAVSVLCLVFAVAACNKKNTSEDIITGENLAAPTTVEVVVEETPVVVEIRNTEIALGTVTFALDKYNLSAAAKKILEANAAVIKSRAAQGFILTVEGNCDERGTISYNIALGEKRASEVKKYYVQLGVSAASISTVSYGKEKPVCYEAAESCYAKNRRADSVLLVK